MQARVLKTATAPWLESLFDDKFVVHFLISRLTDLNAIPAEVESR